MEPTMSAHSIDLQLLLAQKDELETQYSAFKAKGLKLDMTRGKPSPAQLDLANGLLTILGPDDYKSESDIDCRNYGGLSGIAEAKTLFSNYLEVSEEETFVGGNTSLGLMHDIIARFMSHGAADSTTPWSKLKKVKFLCPAPGYDRHFAICEHFGIDMITINLLENGDPDFDQIEKLVANDDSIKGMWFVPKYGNPSGLSISNHGVDRLANMYFSAADFTIMWDNAYQVHHLTADKVQIKNMLTACKDAGNANRVFIIGSTSKVSFAGAGIAAIGASVANIRWLESHCSIQTIGSDKINQLRHVRFFKDINGIEQHMLKHAQILAPKFAAVDQVLTEHLAGQNIATWSSPKGGYFVNLDVSDNCAKKVVALAKDAGVIMTSAGATFPYNNDPRDRNIRIAPSLPALDEITQAMLILCVCIKLATIEVLNRK
jgi:DNA-binding transcriptional MocR family regulator